MSDGYGEILFAGRYRHTALVYPCSPASGKRNDSSYLLPKHDTQAATPVFRQADPHNFQLWCQHTQEPIGCGVEPQRRSDPSRPDPGDAECGASNPQPAAADSEIPSP